MTSSVGHCAHAIRVNKADRDHDRDRTGLTANCLAQSKISAKPNRDAGRATPSGILDAVAAMEYRLNSARLPYWSEERRQMLANRRGFLSFLGSSLIAAPAIVKCASLMPVRGIIMPIPDLYEEWGCAGMNFRLMEFRKEVTREYLRTNPLFVPYTTPGWENLGYPT